MLAKSHLWTPRKPDFRARGQTSIVDYIITSRESLHRVHHVHVENGLQARGANGIGSDHNLLYVDWKLCADLPNCNNITRQAWKIAELENPTIQKVLGRLGGDGMVVTVVGDGLLINQKLGKLLSLKTPPYKKSFKRRSDQTLLHAMRRIRKHWIF